MPAPADDSLFALIPWSEAMAPGAVLLHRFAHQHADSALRLLLAVAEQAPFRQPQTPSGLAMSVGQTCCGSLGWISDRRGYRYAAVDPLSGRAWPALPPLLHDVAVAAAAAAGYPAFAPNACLINRYVPGARMGLHQDRDEGDMTAPVVSLSLGLPASFLFGGLQRRDPTRRFRLEHGDAVVWGGPTRLAFHGIAPLAAGEHPATGKVRYNLTLRQVRT